MAMCDPGDYERALEKDRRDMLAHLKRSGVTPPADIEWLKEPRSPRGDEACPEVERLRALLREAYEYVDHCGAQRLASDIHHALNE